MPTIDVASANPYRVHLGAHLALAIADEAAGADQAAVIVSEALTHIADPVLAALRERGVHAHLISVPDAEAGKTLAVAGRCWDRLGELALGRRDVVIGIGGGAVTDLAGYVAASWMRGVAVIQVPTSLLAMVDAAVGGKTGINTAAGKNLVGAFHEPRAVYLDLAALRTLPEREVVSGSAEIIKCGFIRDPEILERYESSPAACRSVDSLGAGSLLPELIERAVRVKAEVVAQDLKEGGLREILNYGHTFGHAIECREEYRWRHGDAVAVGMVFAAELARARGMLGDAAVEQHRRILRSAGLPVSYPAGRGHFAELRETMGRDKKTRGGILRFVALEERSGESGFAVTRIEGPEPEELEAAFAAVTEGDE